MVYGKGPMSLTDAIGGLEAAQSHLYEEWRGFKVAYANGDVIGNKSILDAADAWAALDTENEPQSVIWEHRGELFYQILLKMNVEIDEAETKALANQNDFDELIKVWSQQ